MRRFAITRRPGQAITRCVLTHIDRAPIDVGLAARQHAAYEEALTGLGFVVTSLPPSEDMPDACFVEDTAVVLGSNALIARPGAATRLAETRDVERVLRETCRIAFVEPPGTLDGGDVLVIGHTIFAGQSMRTNEEGVEQLRAFARPLGYDVTRVFVTGSLHLKTAVTAVSGTALVINRDWVDATAFERFDLVDVDPAEPFGANVLRAGEAVLYPAAFPRTLERIRSRVGRVVRLPFSELLKAEAGLTCCSILIDLRA